MAPMVGLHGVVEREGCQAETSYALLVEGEIIVEIASERCLCTYAVVVSAPM